MKGLRNQTDYQRKKGKPMARKMVIAMVVLMVSGLGSGARAQEKRQAYIIPAGFEHYAAGTVLEYGGNDYVISPAHVMYYLSPAPVHQMVGNPVMIQPQNTGFSRASSAAGMHSYSGPGFFGPGFARDFHRG